MNFTSITSKRFSCPQIWSNIFLTSNNEFAPPLSYQLLDIDKTKEASYSNSSLADWDGNETAEVSKLLFGSDLNHVTMGKPKYEANTLTTAPLRHIWLSEIKAFDRTKFQDRFFQVPIQSAIPI